MHSAVKQDSLKSGRIIKMHSFLVKIIKYDSCLQLVIWGLRIKSLRFRSHLSLHEGWLQRNRFLIFHTYIFFNEFFGAGVKWVAGIPANPVF